MESSAASALICFPLPQINSVLIISVLRGDCDYLSSIIGWLIKHALQTF